jgi:uncharacterized membrane protein YphA (DoxX/SURF4 family)
VSDHKYAIHDLGRIVYGLAGVALGILGLAWRDFAAVWQPLENLGAGAHREVIACIFAAGLLAAGAATLWRRTSAYGFLALGSLHFISALGWMPRIAGLPGVYGTWNGLSEQLALVSAGAVGYGTWASIDSLWKTRTVRIGTLVFGVCAISFAFGHFTAIKEAAAFVPGWIPPGQVFWVWATGAFHLLAGLAIVSGFQAALAARLLTAMMVGFGALVWAPMLFGKPADHFIQCGNAINLALVGAAWVIADSIRRARAVHLAGDSPAAASTRRATV